MDAVDAVLAQAIGPRRGCAQIKGSDLVSTSPEQLQAECGAYEAQPTADHKSVALYAFVFAQVHLLSHSHSLSSVRVNEKDCLIESDPPTPNSDHNKSVRGKRENVLTQKTTILLDVQFNYLMS